MSRGGLWRERRTRQSLRRFWTTTSDLSPLVRHLQPHPVIALQGADRPRIISSKDPRVVTRATQHERFNLRSASSNGCIGAWAVWMSRPKEFLERLGGCALQNGRV